MPAGDGTVRLACGAWGGAWLQASALTWSGVRSGGWLGVSFAAVRGAGGTMSDDGGGGRAGAGRWCAWGSEVRGGRLGD